LRRRNPTDQIYGREIHVLTFLKNFILSVFIKNFLHVVALHNHIVIQREIIPLRYCVGDGIPDHIFIDVLFINVQTLALPATGQGFIWSNKN
jgi:hypothetical protein